MTKDAHQEHEHEEHVNADAGGSGHGADDHQHERDGDGVGQGRTQGVDDVDDAGGHRVPDDDDVRPFWIAADVDPADVDPQLLVAYHEVVTPIYRDFVLNALNPMERSLGVTMALLKSLEAHQAVELGPYLLTPGAKGESALPAEKVDRLLRIVRESQKLAELDLRFRKLREQYDPLLDPDEYDVGRQRRKYRNMSDGGS